MNTQTPTSTIINDPAGVCMLLLARAVTPSEVAFAAHTARQLTRAAGYHIPEPEQAAKVRSARYAILGGKGS